MKAGALCLPVICLPQHSGYMRFFGKSCKQHTAFWSLTRRASAENVLVWLVMCSNSSASLVCSIHPLSRVCQSKAKTLSELEANCCTQTKVDERDFSEQPHWKLPNWRVLARPAVDSWLIFNAVWDQYNWLQCTRMAPQFQVLLWKWFKKMFATGRHSSLSWGMLFQERFVENSIELTSFISICRIQWKTIKYRSEGVDFFGWPLLS